MLLEVIATTVNDAVTAERHGADRIELITGILEGGLTPSLGLIEAVREAVTIPVRVMVRPHARSFCYDGEDVAVMLRDIRHIRAAGGLSLVTGVLRADHSVDVELLERLLEAADGMDVTFHRAFDEIPDQLAALNVLCRYKQITDLLTSGGKATAPEGAERIAVLQRLSSTRQQPSILAGSGLTAEGLKDFLEKTAVRSVHFGSAVRVDGNPLGPVDPGRLKAVRQILNTWKR
ncbi:MULTISPECIES: copper homeostasis protein CutC [unclassified Paenibacillus]|uniref:copper homeostasis protein CutC n=1 Tax=unclassified Paenibacillus TaxID=185978 RepID=UPI0024054410|nr:MULTISPECIES: copper homeostasis protein CutC [unclassified Paenibacillus]MDF9842124.1 copper homeostasis protein [Paenibacillus sp. PastF-2]MDF9848622.1 copper homeostasis protein [Paenibacillus sp. PastM-2]MDF9855191.1 copper homeostasis protein [Paenibacillus sp. PastF-1]MDH6480461.1 copper homeostasis protein [Paenibacillus sp. PastH-2]MDH6507889.1 copper homeostasis protein [Paenibacillus sp. PastM-3]